MRRAAQLTALTLLIVCSPLRGQQPAAFDDYRANPASGDSAPVFPALPPDPYRNDHDILPSLEDELDYHGGAYLYERYDDYLDGVPQDHALGHVDPHVTLLRVPEDYDAPQPLSFFADFLGADPIRSWPRLHWPGADAVAWEPRLVVYGAYQFFGIATEDGNLRTDGIGHQLLVDVDWRVTGTERLHLQFRPLGRGNTGGSFYQFNDPDGYIDNSTGLPDRWWIEAELASVFGGWLHNPLVARDYLLVAGKFPFVLHNRLLINDDVTGLVLSKNTIYAGHLSNLNVQLFYAFDDVDAFDAFSGRSAKTWGVHATADYRQMLLEATYASLLHPRDPTRDAQFTALSATKLIGPVTLAGRALLKWGDRGGRGCGQLFVLESNLTRTFSPSFTDCTGIEFGVFYVNAFHATRGWNSISGGGFDRLRSTLEVNPLVSISAGRPPDDTTGLALGVQLFRHHEDESITPEVVFESPGGRPVWGAGLIYQRKTGPRSFFEARGVGTWSNTPAFRRDGVFLAETILF
ncbi:MAG: hypothetical protein IID44_20925 [Planctomycetes bacterium]|nr:hypothetical protein [Planctomycetota bacterium]